MRDGRCVLTLHRVVPTPELDHDLDWSAFGELLDLVAAGGVPVTADLHTADGAPASAILTFDDGTSDHLRAAEELAARGLRGIFFVPTAPLGEPSRLTPGNVRTLVELGHVVGSHTVDHHRLDTLTEPELRRQLVESKARLEELTATGVEYFAPPGGSSHARLADVLEETGYAASRSTRWGFYRSPDERFEVPCLPVTAFTWRRGWIRGALEGWSLPVSMRIVWELKRRLPTGLAARARSRASGRR